MGSYYGTSRCFTGYHGAPWGSHYGESPRAYQRAYACIDRPRASDRLLSGQVASRRFVFVPCGGVDQGRLWSTPIDIWPLSVVALGALSGRERLAGRWYSYAGIGGLRGPGAVLVASSFMIGSSRLSRLWESV